MRAQIRLLLNILTLISIISTTALYLYPFLLSCSYPNPSAPFRLLTLADPQLEGDTSIYSSRYANAHPVIRELRKIRKQVDLWGNDLYLAHIYRTLSHTVPRFGDKVERIADRFGLPGAYLRRWLPGGGGVVRPTHTVVLGDLVGSQWISEEEFDRRGARYWDVVFRRAKKLDSELIAEEDKKVIADGVSGSQFWNDKLINIVGNHDIGYSGDIHSLLISRFERVYGGAVNYKFEFHAPTVVNKAGKEIHPKLRVIVVNSLNLDGPARDYEEQMRTFHFLNKVFAEDVDLESTATLLLTHVPLAKKKGVCVDGPMVWYYDEDADGAGLLREQNHIQRGSSEMLLGELFGAKKISPEDMEGKELGLILTGHDHEGCDVVHYFDDAEEKEDEEDEEDEDGEGEKKKGKIWKAAKWAHRTHVGLNGKPAIREVTIRSMMGEFGGNAGLVSAWYDVENSSWRFGYSTCPAGVQHIWWAVHIFDVITILLWGVFTLAIVILDVIQHRQNRILRKDVPTVIVTLFDDEDYTNKKSADKVQEQDTQKKEPNGKSLNGSASIKSQGKVELDTKVSNEASER